MNLIALCLMWSCTRQAPPITVPPPTKRDAPSVETEQPGESQEDCLKNCLRDNMARASGPEQIEADCRRACGSNEHGDDQIPSIDLPSSTTNSLKK